MQKRFMNAVGMGTLLLLLAHFAGCSSQNQDTTDTPINTPAQLSVNDAVRDLKPYATSHTVIGVVRTVTPEDKLLTLIDVEEYKTCGLSDCCLYMPVRWQGDMPKMKDIVTVQGTIEATESGLVFSASRLHVEDSTANK